jgi:glycosyltransferase involved in cell wall biosynthesis
VRVLFITNDFPNPYEPGKGVFNAYLTAALAREHQVRVVSPIAWVDELRALAGGAPAAPRRVERDGAEVYHPRYYYPPKVMRRHYGWFFWRSVRGTVRAITRGCRPDAVLAYWAHPDGEAAVRAGLELGIPSAVIVGGSDVLLLPRSRARRGRVAAVLAAANAVLAVNQHLRDRVIELGTLPDRAHVWSQGVDRSRFSPGDRAAARRRFGIPDGAPVLLWVGRMVPVKGLDLLLEACSLLQGRGTQFRLYLVGDGPLRPALEADARARGLSDVHFVGQTFHDALPDWYRAADLTVLPSRSEGLPNVLRESLACGTPFVASRVGGISEIAAGGAALLVPAEDPGALADGLAQGLAAVAAGWRHEHRSVGWEESASTLANVLHGLKGERPGRVRSAASGVTP